MANKSSLAIELKEMSSYPSLEENKRTRDRTPERTEPRSPDTASRNTLTPIVPISSNPSAMSIVEEQRLRAQQAEERKNYPSLQPPNVVSNPPMVHQNVPPVQNSVYRNTMPANQAVMMSIPCSGCRGIIQYPSTASVVYCLQCRKTTATRPLINIVCTFCRQSSFYDVNQSHVRCRCGTVYAIRPNF